jgi:hypothetical protein
MQRRDHMELRQNSDRLISEIEHMIRGIRISEETYFYIKNLLKRITDFAPYRTIPNPNIRYDSFIEDFKDYRVFEKEENFPLFEPIGSTRLKLKITPPPEDFIEKNEMEI